MIWITYNAAVAPWWGMVNRWWLQSLLTASMSSCITSETRRSFCANKNNTFLPLIFTFCVPRWELPPSLDVIPQSLLHYDPLTLWYMTITTKYPKPSELTKWLVLKNCKSDSLSKTFNLQPSFSQNTSHSHDNLRRVSKSPLLHPFTHCRSDTLDWHVMRDTSADSSRLIHSVLAHSSMQHYGSFFCHHRTSWIQAPINLHHELQPFETWFHQVLHFLYQVLHHHYHWWLHH